MNDIVEQHRQWKERQIMWAEINDIAEAEKMVPCAQCGCMGNGECGHEVLNAEECCTLSSNMVCPCCRRLAVENRKDNRLKAMGQEELFPEANDATI